MITDCPHCFNKVLPAADGTCPSCRKNVNDASGLDPDFTSVTIRTREPLPPCCMLCGFETDRLQEVSRGAGATGVIARFLLSGLVFILVGLFSLLLAIIGSNRLLREGPSIVLRIPICGDCSKKGAVRPFNIDMEDYTMQFLVHKRFKEELEILRSRGEEQ